jgi:hypothetical protein
MDFWHILAGGTAVGLLASCWEQIKGFFWKILNLLIQQVEVPTEPGHEAIIAHLIARYKRSRIYDRMYGAWWEYRRDGRYGLVAYETFGQRAIIFWNGWVPFIFSNQRERRTSANSQNNNGSDAAKIYSTITFIRGSLDIDALLRDACAERNHQTWYVADEEEEGRSRFVIHYVPKRATSGEKEENGGWSSSSNGLPWYCQGHYRLINATADELGKARTSNGKALDNLIFPPRIKSLMKEVELWRKSRAWYQEKGLAWKRGWLLYGPPGTGKTALARAFAEDLNMPIYVFNLAEMGNHELLRAWNEMQVNVPCIALIEDIDNVFHGRENVARKNGIMNLMLAAKKEDDKNDRGPGMMTPLTFDCLLNCLDGVERSDGVFTIITTNDISKIDPALGQPRKLPDGEVEFISTRPGRIDKAVELSYMELADKKRLAQRILGAYPDELDAMYAFIDKFADLQETPAQFQERCGQIALKRFWAEQDGVAVPREQLNGRSRLLPRETVGHEN